MTAAAAAAPPLRREWLRVGVAVSVLVLLLALTQASARLDNLFYDLSLRLGQRATPADIIIVAIDEESLARLGPLPWPRSVHAQLLTQLAKAKPRATIYDVLFMTPAAGDADLAAALKANSPTYLPMLFRVPGRDGRGYDALPPVPVLAAAAVVGQADIHPDRDGVVRRIDLALDGMQRWTHLAAMAAGVAPTTPPLPPQQLLRRVDPVLVSYGGPPGHIRNVPLVSVLDGALPPEFLRGKYVLVGATAAALGDQYSTPLAGNDGVMAGVEIQANLLDTLLTGRVIRPAAWPWQALLAVAAVWLLMLAFLRLPPPRAALAGVALLIAVLALSAMLLRLGALWLPPSPALVGLLAVLPLWAWRRLAAVNAYMGHELETLAAAPGAPLANAARQPGDDPLERQMGLLTATIAQVVRLRAQREEVLQLLTHDMRSPQASILALLAQAGEAVPRALHDKLGHHAERTIALADGFLNLARADAGAYARTAVDLADILVEAVDDVWPQAQARRVTIMITGAEHETLVNGNRGLLTRALINLLNNAVKYSPEGAPVEASLEVAEAAAMVRIADRGMGMSAAALAGLFRRFGHDVQGDGGAPKGIGLGLTFVDAVARGHDGSITCTSVEGEGTVFTLTLPRLSVVPQ